MGLPPHRIDILTSISGVTNEDVFKHAVRKKIGGKERINRCQALNFLMPSGLMSKAKKKPQCGIYRCQALNFKTPPLAWLDAGEHGMLEIPEARAFSIDDAYEFSVVEALMERGVLPK